MKTYTEEEITQALAKIENMEHAEMCRLWRNTPLDENLYFRSDLPTGAAFKARLFDHFGGFTPAISKSIGWK